MNWNEFIREVARQKLSSEKLRLTFIDTFGDNESPKIDKTVEGHLREIYKRFESECAALTTAKKGKKEILRDYLQTLYATQRDFTGISDRPQPPTNPQNIPTPESILEFNGRDRPLIFSEEETFVQDIIDQVNNSLEIGSRLRVVCSPRYSEPLFMSEGKLPLSENDKIREQDIIKKFDINYTNDACAAVVTKPNWSDSPLTIRYCTSKYAEILSLRDSIPYVGIITSNVLRKIEERLQL